MIIDCSNATKSFQISLLPWVCPSLNCWMEPNCVGAALSCFGSHVLEVCGREPQSPWGKECFGMTTFSAVMEARISGVCNMRGFQGD